MGLCPALSGSKKCERSEKNSLSAWDTLFGQSCYMDASGNDLSRGGPFGQSGTSLLFSLCGSFASGNDGFAAGRDVFGGSQLYRWGGQCVCRGHNQRLL